MSRTGGLIESDVDRYEDSIGLLDATIDCLHVFEPSDVNQADPESMSKIPKRLVPLQFTQENVPVKRPHWTAAVNREKYGTEIEQPWVLSKMEVLEEIKWSLTAGVSKSLFTQSADGTVRYNAYCRVRGLSQGCVMSLLRPICDAVTARTRLERFVISSSCLLPTLKSLRAWMADYLKLWKERVLELPFQSLLQCSIILGPSLDELLTVYALVESIVCSKMAEDFNMTNSLISRCFYVAEQASITGNWNSQLLHGLLLISTESSIFEINRWISGKSVIDRTLNDSGNRLEFFIVVQDEDSSKYSIRENLNPLFCDIASDLIAARKSVVTLRRLLESSKDTISMRPSLDDTSQALQPKLADLCSSDSGPSALPTSAFRKQLCFSVKSRCLDLSKLLVSTLREELHLEKLFQEIRDIVTISAFSDVPYERKLDHLLDAVYLRRYAERVSETFSSNFNAGLWKFRWSFDVTEEKQHGLDNPTKVIGLNCQIPWPLDTIVTEKHMASYGKMFHFFQELECARTRLARLRIHDLASSPYIGRRLSIQRFELFVFLTKIMAAVSYEFFGHFDMQAILDSTSIDDLCERHDEIVNVLAGVTLSDDRSVAWTRLMMQLTELSKKMELDWEDGQIREIDLIKSRLDFDSCQRFFGKLLEKRYAGFAQ